MTYHRSVSLMVTKKTTEISCWKVLRNKKHCAKFYQRFYLNGNIPTLFKVRACLRGGVGPKVVEVTCGGSQHLSC